jgi:ssDNA-binding Zn-finger/Zn-ribbon topoisomerase 1
LGKFDVKMRGKEKVSECDPDLAVLIKKANYLLDESFDLENLLADIRKRSINEMKSVFNKTVEHLEPECLEDNQWIEKVINGKTTTLKSSMIDPNAPAGRSFQEDLKFHATALLSQTVTGTVWIEAEKIIRKGKYTGLRMRYPISDLAKIVKTSQDYRRAFTDIIEWNSLPEEWQKDGSISSNRLFSSIRIIEGVLQATLRNAVLFLVIDRKIDTRRIFKCPICKRIVWKKQINAETCGSKKCSQRHKYLKSKSKSEISPERDAQRKSWHEMWNQ